MKKVLDYGLLPALFLATLSAGWLVNRWVTTQHGVAGVVAAWMSFFFLAGLIRLLERLRPFEQAWNQRDGQLVNDMALPLIASLTFFMVPFATWYATTLTSVFAHTPYLSWLRIWPANLPAIIAIPVGIVIYDLGPHIGHRWSHKVPLLWRFHSVHHAAPRLSAINTFRIHPGNSLVQILCTAPIPILLGMPPEIATWYAILNWYGGILTHANIDMRYGPFSYLLNTVELHRWHHSPQQRETDTNFGEVTVVWDHVFGTYYNPARRPRRDVGVDFPVSTHLLQQLWQPLTIRGHRPGNSMIRMLPPGEAGAS